MTPASPVRELTARRPDWKLIYRDSQGIVVRALRLGKRGARLTAICDTRSPAAADVSLRHARGNSCRVPRIRPRRWYDRPCSRGGRIARMRQRGPVAGGREQMAYWPARGEVAEPGLRRTPGERVNGFPGRVSGFKSPPPLTFIQSGTVSLHYWRGAMGKVGAWGAIHTQPWTRSTPMSAWQRRKSRAKFSVGDFGRSILRTDRHVARTMYSKRNSTRVFSPA